jgi:hypothetical protein
MNETLARRLAAITGLALAAAIALWWLGSTRLALDQASDASRPATDTLNALGLVRGMVLAILGVRVGASCGWRAGVAAAMLLVAPSWPVLALAWSASAAPWTQLALTELLLLSACVALPLLGHGLSRALRQAELVEVIGTGVGAALAASVWLTRGAWPLS